MHQLTLSFGRTIGRCLAPLRQHGRVLNDDVANRSSLARSATSARKQRATGVCSVCRSHNEIPTDFHRVGSSRCPFTQQTPFSKTNCPVTMIGESNTNAMLARVIEDQRAYNMARGGSISCKACESQGIPMTESHFAQCPCQQNPHNPSAEELRLAEAAMLDFQTGACYK